MLSTLNRHQVALEKTERELVDRLAHSVAVEQTRWVQQTKCSTARALPNSISTTATSAEAKDRLNLMDGSD
jgi:hypothetical protein